MQAYREIWMRRQKASGADAYEGDCFAVIFKPNLAERHPFLRLVPQCGTGDRVMNNVVLMTNFCLGKMRRVFFMSYPETKKDYKKSRICYTIGDTASQTIAQLAGGTFLVTLMAALGISDGNMGVVASFGSMAAVAQLISMKLARRFPKNKLFVCLTVLQKLWLAFIFFIPLLPISGPAKKGLMVACFCFAQISMQVGTPATVDWIASLIPAKLRGRYFSIKDSVAVFVVVTVMLVMGILIDVMKTGNITWGFIILGSAIGILSLINVAAFMKMKEPKVSCINDKGQEPVGNLAKRQIAAQTGCRKVNISQEIRNAFHTKKFCQALLLNCLWMTAFYIASPFNSSFQIKDLRLPYTYIMILSFVTSMLRIYLTPKAGKLADRIGMAKVMKWALAAMGGHYLLMAASSPGNAYVMAACAALFSSLAWTFIGIGMLGIQLDFLAEDKRIIQYSLLSVLSGMYGFAISFLGGRLVDHIQRQQWMIGGRAVYAQNITNIMGCVFILVTILYLQKRIQPASEKSLKVRPVPKL